MLLALLLSGAMRWDIRRPWLRFATASSSPRPRRAARLCHLAVLNRASAPAPSAPAIPASPSPRRPVRADVGAPARPAAPRRPARSRRIRGPDDVPQANTALRPRMPFAAARPWRSSWRVPARSRSSWWRRGGLTPGRLTRPRIRPGAGPVQPGLPRHWNDFGIDERPASSVVHGTPEDWFAPYGWRVNGTPEGMEWGRSRAPSSRRAAATTRPRRQAWPGSGPARAAATAR